MQYTYHTIKLLIKYNVVTIFWPYMYKYLKYKMTVFKNENIYSCSAFTMHLENIPDTEAT